MSDLGERSPHLSRPVTIVVLCWNRWSLTERCLATLRDNTDLESARVIVVDNGSTDETPAELARLSWVRAIRSEQNLGYVRGNNLGIAHADPTSDVVLLNNDTEIRQRDWLERLQEAAASSADVGVVGCRLVLPDGRLLHAGAYILPETLVGQQIGSLEMDVNQYPGVRDVQAVTFACVYLKRETIDRVGVLSESYQSYYEDTDYCLRAGQAGFRVVCCGDVTLMHAEHGSTSDRPELFEQIYRKSRAEFGRRWKGSLEAAYRHAVHWPSTLSTPSGYAASSRAILRRLDPLGIRMSYAYVYGPGTSNPLPEPENTGDYYLNVIAGRRPERPPAISVVHARGDAFERSSGRYRIGYTIPEGDDFPEEWVPRTNQLDEVWVPSAFDRETLLHCGIVKPIRVMPLGVDTDHFHPRIRAFPNPHGLFVFLACFEWSERSAPERILQVFHQTFSATEPVALVCKVTSRGPRIRLRERIRALRLRGAGGRIRFIVNREIPRDELGALYRSVSCFVSTGGGDDARMMLLEATACGLPVIAPDRGWLSELVGLENAFLLRTHSDPYGDGDLEWPDPDPEHLAGLFRHAYEHAEEAAEMGRRAAAETRERSSAGVAAARIAARLDEIARDPAAAAEESRVAARAAARSSASRPTERPLVAIDVSRAIGQEVNGLGRYALNIVRGIAASGAGSSDDLEFLLLPGFAAWVHPEYGRTLQFPHRCGRHIRLYRGELPAFSSRRSAVPGVRLVHSTTLAVPRIECGPLLVTLHDLSFATNPELHTRENVRYCTSNLARALRRDVRFVAVSEYTKRELMQMHGVAADQISVVPNAFDSALFRPYGDRDVARVRIKYGLPRRFALFVGALEPRKNLDTVLTAYERNAEKLPPLVVAGASGWRNQHVRDQMARLRDRVTYLGFVQEKDLGALYAAARVVLYPSLYEGFGLPVLEAMACGTPVITSRVTSLPEVAGDAGILLDDPRDAGALAEAVRRLAEDDAEHARRVELGFAQTRHFSLEAVTARLLEVYRSMIAASAGADATSSRAHGGSRLARLISWNPAGRRASA